MISESDIDLAQIRAGDAAAFEQAYRILKIPIYTLALRLLQNRAAAEDVTQETFLRLYASPPGPEVRKPRAWLFRVARNLAIDALRQRREENLKEDFATPEENLALRLDVERALAALPEDEREILTLHLNGGLTFSEVAGVVGLSLPSVYRRYKKAVLTLRGLLEGVLS